MLLRLHQGSRGVHSILGVHLLPARQKWAGWWVDIYVLFSACTLVQSCFKTPHTSIIEWVLLYMLSILALPLAPNQSATCFFSTCIYQLLTAHHTYSPPPLLLPNFHLHLLLSNLHLIVSQQASATEHISLSRGQWAMVTAWVIGRRGLIAPWWVSE